jgi:hypothetical protein
MLAKPKWATGLGSRREVGVAATVMVVLALAAWAMIGFHAGRPSPLPGTGNPVPTLSAQKVDPASEMELVMVADALTRRDKGDKVLMEAIYNTPELFAALSRHDAAQEGGGEAEAETLFQTYRRYHGADRYSVFTLILESSGPDLTGYHPGAMSRLRSSSGRETPAVRWVEHPTSVPDRRRGGLLYFSHAAANDQPLLAEDEDWLELVLLTLDGRERTLRWELPIAYATVPNGPEEEQQS